jgi:hypothetical protein
MKKLLMAVLIGVAGVASAQTVSVKREQLGSGTPGLVGLENATRWDNNIFHAPQYLPGYPTAASLWARVVEVPCEKAGDRLECKGYNWLPEMGRGEYLMIKPVIVEKQKPIVITNTIVKEVPGPERIREVYVEVPVKKKGE